MASDGDCIRLQFPQLAGWLSDLRCGYRMDDQVPFGCHIAKLGFRPSCVWCLDFRHVNGWYNSIFKESCFVDDLMAKRNNQHSVWVTVFVQLNPSNCSQIHPHLIAVQLLVRPDSRTLLPWLAHSLIPQRMRLREGIGIRKGPVSAL